MRFNHRKLYFELKKPTEYELRTMELIELMSFQPWNPDLYSWTDIVPDCTYKKKYLLVIPVEEWRRFMGFSPDKTSA